MPKGEIMELIEKLEPLIIFSAVIIGLIFSNIDLIAQNTSYLITIFLCLMIFGLFLEVPLNELKNSFKNVKRQSLASPKGGKKRALFSCTSKVLGSR